MSILEDVLIEEYNRCERIKQLYLENIESLPKGCLSQKKISGKIYMYLQHREGAKIVSQYVPYEQVEEVRKQIERRRRLQKGIRECEADQKKIRKAIGKRLDERI